MNRIHFSVPIFSIGLILLLTIFSWSFFLIYFDFTDGFSLTAVKEFLSRLIGWELGGDSAFLSSQSWFEAFRLGLTTLKMSILAIGIAAVFSFLTFAPGARTMVFSDKGILASPIPAAIFAVIKVSYTLTRGIPELLWAMLIVFVLPPSIFAGAIALAIHNYGVLGRLLGEAVENMDQRPIKALRSSGANSIQILFYCIMPEIFPKFLTYLLYRWEVVIRTTVVVGFLAAGGLGRELKLSMSWFHYDEVGGLLVTYMLLVFLVDYASLILRKYVN